MDIKVNISLREFQTLILIQSQKGYHIWYNLHPKANVFPQNWVPDLNFDLLEVFKVLEPNLLRGMKMKSEPKCTYIGQ